MQVPVLASITSYATAKAALVPLVLAALLVDAAIIAIWYILGYVLNNSGVRQSARAELNQLIGTALLIVIITGVLVIFGGFFQSMLSHSTLLGQPALNKICTNLDNSPLYILSSGHPGFNSVLCGTISGGAPDAITSQIDYPLAASGVVIANMTNQAVMQVNDFFVVDSYIGFLKSFSPAFGICVAEVPDSGVCVFPLPVPPPAFYLGISYTPLAGLSMVYSAMASEGVLIMSAVYSFIMQLSFVSLFLFLWPYLIFVGLVLRATFFTRKIGGLFIAVAIGAIFFFPMVFAIQYLTLGNGFGNVSGYGNIFSGTGSISYTYGFNGILANPQIALPAPGASCSATESAPYAGENVLCQQYDYSTFPPTPGTVFFAANVLDVYPNGTTVVNLDYQGEYVVQNDYLSATNPSVMYANPTGFRMEIRLATFGYPISPSLSLSGGQSYVPNFYVFPSVKAIANYYGCWPPNGGSLGAFGGELEDIAFEWIPFLNIAQFFESLGGGLVNGAPDPNLPAECHPSNAVPLLFAYADMYGIYGVSAYLLPILNILITLAAIIGLSSLLGGDTSLGGIGRLI